MINESVLYEILESGDHRISDIKPSEWAESRIIMPKPYAGALRYDESTPYTREIIDRFASDDPVTDIALMGSAQFGKTKSIIIPLIGFLIENDPGNIIMTVGHEGLIKEAMADIDEMLDSTGLRKLIKPSAQRAKASQSGDTDTVKQFPGGYFKISSASNPKIWRQANYKIGLIDDYEAVKGNTKIAGNIRDLIEKRFTAYAKTKKIFYVSSPELAQGSNILEVYLLGDCRKFLVPCPCCGEAIELLWTVEPMEGCPAEVCGITWKLDDEGHLIESSVGYICQACGGFFDDSDKLSITRKGFWKPTKKPIKPEFTSYYMNSLYSPPFMDDWKHYVYKYLECHPQGGTRIESKYQAFLNLNLGLPYEKSAESPKANELLKNTRPYEIGIIPEKLSYQDGNGKIMLLTCACDLNGTENDARLDYEILAHSESGSTYSVIHGSIGTFIPLEGKNKADREKWTYEHYKDNSVWPEFDKVIEKLYETDTERVMKVFITGVDTGHYTLQAYDYIERSRFNMVALKGDKESKYIRIGVDVPNFKIGKERSNLYLVQVNQIKDELASLMKLKFDERNESKQPYGFMNFPQPAGNLYQLNTYFSHFEAEHRVTESVDGEVTLWTWKKKSNVHQNHMWDCFDDKTEVLTENGWMFFSELLGEELLATVNLGSDNLEYQKPFSLTKKQYEGDVIIIDGKRINCIATPNHRMVVYRKKWNAISNSGKMSEIPEIVLAKDLRVTDTIKVSCNWHSEGDKYYFIPKMTDVKGRLIAEEKIIDSKLWASFLGIFIAEGSTQKIWNDKRKSYAHRVMIHQNKGDSFDKIKTIMDLMPFKYNVYKSNAKNFVFVIPQKQLYEELIKYGVGAKNKRSGEWVKKQSAEIISAFLDFAILGDGYINPIGRHRKYYTISKLLADDIQELFIKIGAQSNIRSFKPKNCTINGGNYESQIQYHISENKSKFASLRKSDNTPNFHTSLYTGMVYCASVPNGTLVLRRQGKSFIAGNCRIYNMVLRDIVTSIICKDSKIKNFTWSDCVNIIHQLIAGK